MRKPKQKVEQKLIIPECFLKQLKAFHENVDESAAAKFLLTSVEEIDTSKQASNLKKAIDELKKLSDKDNLDMASTCLEVLCYIFMDCHGKNPCRRIIASYFQALSSSLWTQVLEYLNKVLVQTIDGVKMKAIANDKPGEDIDFRKHVDTVCSLMENFEMGGKCISANMVEVLEFLTISLEYQVIKEGLVGTPALQTAAMLDCLMTIKATMGVLQKCNKELMGTLGDHHRAREFLRRFVKVIITILKNDDFFPDCRSAAGMAFPLIVRLVTKEETLVSVIVSLFFPTYATLSIPKECSVSSQWILAFVDTQNIKGLSGFSYLSICRGVMAMVPRDVLVTKENFLHDRLHNECGTLLFDVLFPEITSLCSTLKDSSSLVAFRTLAYWTSETREAICTASDKDCLKSRLVGTSEIIQTLLNFVWNNWDHPVEAMRYHTREIFDNVIKMHIICSGNEPRSDPFIEELAKKLCGMDCFVRGKYGALCCLVNILGARAILEVHATVPQDLMTIMCEQSIVPHAMEFAEKMFQCHYEQLLKDTDQHLQDWFKIWVIPGLKSLSSGTKTVRKHVTEYYIPKLLKCCPQSLEFMVSELRQPYFVDGYSVDNVGCLVTCLKTARHLGLLPRAELLKESEENTKEHWHGTIPVSVLEQSLCHLDDEIRCDVLGLICDSVRTTEPLTATDVALLRKFFSGNMNSQSPSFRQRFLGLTKKLFIRLRDGGRSLNKKLSGRNADVELLTTQLKLYIEFLHWFAHLQFGSLFPGSSFPRKTTALQNLNLLLQIFPIHLKNDDPYSIFECSEVLSSRCVHILLDCLNDTYDVNKQMAFDLLVACPSSIHPFMDQKFASEWAATATQSAISPKPINVSKAAYMFKLIVRKSPHQLTLITDNDMDNTTSEFAVQKDFLNNFKPYKERGDCGNVSSQISNMTLVDEQKETSLPCEQIFRVLTDLVKLLQTQIVVAQKSLLQAAFEAPIHGVLFCIREMICDFDLNVVAGSKLWQSLVMAILQSCYDVAETVSPVVTNSSPEGNLSSDFLDDEDDFEEQESFAPQAQILLVCCWRAMKEVSLLLGELTKRVPVREKGHEHGFLSFEEFETIGQLFTNILLTSKHRGAYELAHEGFVKLCHMLWRCKQRQLQCLPQKFLTTLLSDISSDCPTPWLCGTRRSAGLPFFFKAIITTEPSTTGKTCFKAVMRELLDTAFKPVSAQESNKDTTLPQVHARNVLRALYKETKLGEDVYPYVTEGLQIAVEGFLSDSWAVRNSSTLLFSALMNRIFGPQKSQEEKRKQGMTGREFFSRFPSLHSFLIKQLEISLKTVESKNSKSIHLYPSLYPVLLLLSRLRPSAMDGNDSTLNMAAFIPYVLRCSKSCVLKTRAMAARALVPLVSGEALPAMLKSLLERLPVDSNQRVCQNHVHGCLLQVRDLLTSISMNTALSTRTKEIISNQFTPLFLKCMWLASDSNPCFMTRAVFLYILRKFIIDKTWITGETQSNSPSPSNSPTLQAVQSLVDNTIKEVIEPSDINSQLFPVGRIFVKEELARIALQPLYAKSRVGSLNPEDVSFILDLLSTSDYEITLIALEFLQQLFLIYKEVGSLANQVNVMVNKLLVQVIEPTMQSSCLSQLFRCLSLAPSSLRFPWQLADDRLVELNEGWKHVLLAFKNGDQRSEVKCSLLEFSSVLVGQLHEEVSCETSRDDAASMLGEWVSNVEECCGNEESEALRLTVSQVLGSGKVSCVLIKPHKDHEDLTFRLWKLIVRLLVDDSIDVKNLMAAGLVNVFQAVQEESTKYSSVHCALTLHYVIRKPLELFWAHSTSSCLLWLISLLDDATSNTSEIDTDTSNDAYDDMGSIDRLFEKGPTNTFFEDCILAEIVYTTFLTWVEECKDCAILFTQRSQLLNLLQTFVKNQVAKCAESLPQNLLYSNLYKTLAGLAMMNTLLNASATEDEKQETLERRQELQVFNETISLLKEIRRKDRMHCFSHFKLQELAHLVLGD